MSPLDLPAWSGTIALVLIVLAVASAIYAGVKDSLTKDADR